MTENREWVRLRRSLIEHVQNGNMTMFEFFVYVMLKLLANEETGEVLATSRTIHQFLRPGPHLSQIGVQRVIHNLESKGYIARDFNNHAAGYPIRIQELPATQSEKC